jgi:hypothetical protein
MLKDNEIQNSGIFDFLVFPTEDNPLARFTGQNRKGLLITVAGEESPELRSFLEKILQAVNYSIAEDALSVWLTSPQPFSFVEIAHQVHLTRAVFFGIQPAQAGLNLLVKLYTPVHYGQSTFLFCDNLAQIQQNASLKRQLWEAMKTMFL